MSFGDAIQRRADLLRKRGADVQKAFVTASRIATRAAIDTATEKTPPAGDLKGTNQRASGLKQHWETASQQVPEVIHEPGVMRVETQLANDLDYASYVNNGHLMHKHFVPGLIINPYTDKLESSPDGEGGIMVGTITRYVPGVFAREAGVEVFEDISKRELLRIAKEALHD